MKKIISFLAAMLFASLLFAQTYPDPEFSNEVYYLKKDSAYILVRLEKGLAKQQTKVNMITGSEYSYTIEGKASSVRLNNGKNISFIFSTSAVSSNPFSDSVMKANGMDPNSISGFSDPSKMITLYKLDIGKNERKISMAKGGGVYWFSKKGDQGSNKYSFSLKKIRNGYWELVVDKPLPKGEYAFSVMGVMGSEDITESQTVFTFGID